MRIVIGFALLAMAFPGTAPAQDEEPVPKAKPIGNPATWIPANGYPPAAAASGEQGRVAFTLTVDETGRVSECKVTQSSESPLLDESTCNFMTANGRFEVPRNKKNKPTMGTWSSAMTWKLVAAPPPAPAPGTVLPPSAAPSSPSVPATAPAANPAAGKRAPTAKKP